MSPFDGAGSYGAEGPLVLHGPEDLLALDYVIEYGDWRLHAVLESHDLMPPKDFAAVPAPVMARSAPLCAMTRTGTREDLAASPAACGAPESSP
ncbi:hypothetical protein [Streptomyces tauricus]|uniref:hypothetical protein n=1 Tax=Streptomyces tauricus TaxID=68274 RepID=UPI001678D866|nr:hypothetical protein [Streptomyces tauricus]MCW8103409.1 hypothetical protein [Streptomyces tauricus]